MAVRASQTGIYYARTLFVMGDERQKVQPKKLERKKAIAVGYGCLFRPKNRLFCNPVHKRLMIIIIIKYRAIFQEGGRFFQQQDCEELHLN
ncbi:hypothetical protein ABG775_23355 [Peribacillus simplex]|uniref:hypothetical protein n=1 Tax=Peribacillus TaxID=2675229 RepID=UPI001780D725|nr:hypothetical protein [Brevibacillus sp. JNUCC-41]QOS91093.1 hypothetical protein JNUCC41_04880 [Brevibacillus sp. JNUCC-41]